ncbi:MAG: DUF3617 domain-containing protein [Gammaproteobacteria bacterium]|nr:DUF3617 domain-containing protein [Gammaproteobacteria bacterium]
MFQKILFIGAISIANLLHAENYNFQPGLWRTTTTQETIEIVAPTEIKKMMQHLSQMPMSDTECLKNINSMFDADPDDAEECKRTITRANSNRTSVEMVCTGEDGTSKGAGEINLKGKSFTSSLVMTSINGPIKIKMKIMDSGEYIGPCK